MRATLHHVPHPGPPPLPSTLKARLAKADVLLSETSAVLSEHRDNLGRHRDDYGREASALSAMSSEARVARQAEQNRLAAQLHHMPAERRATSPCASRTASPSGSQGRRRPLLASRDGSADSTLHSTLEARRPAALSWCSSAPASPMAEHSLRTPAVAQADPSSPELPWSPVAGARPATARTPLGAARWKPAERSYVHEAETSLTHPDAAAKRQELLFGPRFSSGLSKQPLTPLRVARAQAMMKSSSWSGLTMGEHWAPATRWTSSHVPVTAIAQAGEIDNRKRILKFAQ
eukprot:CAMPEP_0183596612 /NCGR_PEP_ID=MMETSP0371-20130417/175464_1 /TAXON_ID=268820 /ORGANISM="Peridinium aciculiferum, Strain PAER-2" /LENGTH=289 /DNA_ID=CAMNT_0025808505 /DNA_START=52 /DNA_END=921 /DNA_ORIENTATION=+